MNEDNSKPKTTKTIKFYHIVLGILIIVALWAFSGAFLFWKFDDPATRGAFGDMFGAVNSLFSGLAFVGVVYAILQQQASLSIQKEELEATREAVTNQNEALIKQNFEHTFFQLLRLHGDNVASINFRWRNGDENNPVFVLTSGRDCFKTFMDRYIIEYKNHPLQLRNGLVLPQKHAHIEMTYGDFFDKNQAKLGHYFRNLYHIVKLVDESEMEDKKNYTNLIRAQLSSYELFLLFYNCLSFEGGKKFKPLVEQYTLLKHIDKSLLIEEDHDKLYAASAFE